MSEDDIFDTIRTRLKSTGYDIDVNGLENLCICREDEEITNKEIVIGIVRWATKREFLFGNPDRCVSFFNFVKMLAVDRASLRMSFRRFLTRNEYLTLFSDCMSCKELELKMAMIGF